MKLCVFAILMPFFCADPLVSLAQFRQASWPYAGSRDQCPRYSEVINVMDFGVDATGQTPVDESVLQAIQSSGEFAREIYFPPGEYLFRRPLHLRDSLILRGAGADSTRLVFDLGGVSQHAIVIRGTLSDTILRVVGDIEAGQKYFRTSTVGMNTGGLPLWYLLLFDDKDIMYSSWAFGLAGGLYEVESVAFDTFRLRDEFRLGIESNKFPRMIPVNPVKGVGIECLQIIRLDATVHQSSTIYFEYAVDCHVTGVRSTMSNFAHVDIRQSAHITVAGGYFEDAHAFGGGGQGNGVVLQGGTSLSLVENNIFRRLRHAMLLQSGANANTLAYNYSYEPFWTSFPNDSAGDLVCHGNFPYLNLFEGNIVQNIVIDASHGKNGPHNFFFRNRAEHYGIFMSPNSGTDSTHFVGNEITSSAFLRGLYVLIGRGNVESGNLVRGTLVPSGSNLPEAPSMYLIKTPKYWHDQPWPLIGNGNPNISYQNPARNRAVARQWTDCCSFANSSVSPEHTLHHYVDFDLFPNPSDGDLLCIELKNDHSEIGWSIQNLQGDILMMSNRLEKGIQCVDLPKGFHRGMYLVCIHGRCKKWIKL